MNHKKELPGRDSKETELYRRLRGATKAMKVRGNKRCGQDETGPGGAVWGAGEVVLCLLGDS